MNTYIAPIVDSNDSPYPFNKTVTATGLLDAEDRIINWIVNTWDIDDDLGDEPIMWLAETRGIYVGEIEELDY